MADISDDIVALAYLLKQVLLADADAPILLALGQSAVRTASDLLLLEVSQDIQTASDLMSPELSQDKPLKYNRPAEGSDKAKKNVPLLPAEMCQIRGLKDYIRYHMSNVADKYYGSLEDGKSSPQKTLLVFM